MKDATINRKIRTQCTGSGRQLETALVETPLRPPGPREVLIAVRYVPMNGSFWLASDPRGLHPCHDEFVAAGGFVFGNRGVGQVIACAPDCMRIRVGDHVSPQQGRKVFMLQTVPACDEPSDEGSISWPGSHRTPAWRRGRINARRSNDYLRISAFLGGLVMTPSRSPTVAMILAFVLATPLHVAAQKGITSAPAFRDYSSLHIAPSEKALVALEPLVPPEEAVAMGLGPLARWRFSLMTKTENRWATPPTIPNDLAVREAQIQLRCTAIGRLMVARRPADTSARPGKRPLNALFSRASRSMYTPIDHPSEARLNSIRGG
jgi:hypothetical protein